MFYLTQTQEWWTAAYLKSRTLTGLLHIGTSGPIKFKRNLTADFKGISMLPAQRLTLNIPLQQYEERHMHCRSSVSIKICRRVSELKNKALLIFRT